MAHFTLPIRSASGTQPKLFESKLDSVLSPSSFFYFYSKEKELTNVHVFQKWMVKLFEIHLILSFIFIKRINKSVNTQQ